MFNGHKRILEKIHNDVSIFLNGYNLFSNNRNFMEEKESDEKISICIDFPGFAKNEISISINENVLEIQAVQKDGENVSRTKKIFHTLQNVKTNTAKAKLENGILSIEFERENKKENEKQIIEIE